MIKAKATISNKTQKEIASHNLKLGTSFEAIIIRGCQWYQKHDMAIINKCPEPFHVISRTPDGKFIGRFGTSKAQPDFQGTLKNGRSFVAEAKATSADRLRQNIITDKQAELLEQHEQMGAYCCIICKIQEQTFVVPWDVWKNMKDIYGRKYVTQKDIAQYLIPEKYKRNSCPFLYFVINELKTGE